MLTIYFVVKIIINNLDYQVVVHPRISPHNKITKQRAKK